jgi:hypothetical protein
VSRERAVDNSEYVPERLGVGGEQEAQREGQRQHPLAQGPWRQHFVRQERRAFHHPPRAAARAEATPLAAESDQLLGVTVLAAHAQKNVIQAKGLAGRPIVLDVSRVNVLTLDPFYGHRWTPYRNRGYSIC